MRGRVLVRIILFSLLLWCLSSCGIKSPTEEELKAMIPEDIINYTLDGFGHRPEIEDFQIVRRQTNDKTDLTDCIITLKDYYMFRTEYITLTSEYWDTGGWQLKEWEPYQEEEVELLGDFNSEIFIRGAEAVGYNEGGIEILSQDVQPESKYATATFNVDDEHTNLSAQGTMEISAEFCRSDYYPKDYYWETYADESLVDFHWKFPGIWKGKTKRWTDDDYTFVYVIAELFNLDEYGRIDGSLHTVKSYEEYSVPDKSDLIYDRSQWYSLPKASISGANLQDMCLTVDLQSGAGGQYDVRVWLYADHGECACTFYHLMDEKVTEHGVLERYNGTINWIGS